MICLLIKHICKFLYISEGLHALAIQLRTARSYIVDNTFARQTSLEFNSYCVVEGILDSFQHALITTCMQLKLHKYILAFLLHNMLL